MQCCACQSERARGVTRTPIREDIVAEWTASARAAKAAVEAAAEERRRERRNAMIKFDRVCKRHGLTVHAHYGTGGKMPCCACRSERKRGGARTPIREDIVEERAEAAEERGRERSGRYHQDMDLLKEFMGGKCEHCGYEHDLEFHHVTPRRTGSGSTLSDIILHKAYDEALEEIKGCEMLCSDCHDDADAELRSLENPEK